MPADSLVDATPQNLVSCQRWVSEHITAKGQTDIRQPLMQALQLLKSAPPGPGGGPRLPTVFLIVDGAWGEPVRAGLGGAVQSGLRQSLLRLKQSPVCVLLLNVYCPGPSGQLIQ